MKQALDVDITLATSASANVKLKIGITGGGLANVLDRRLAQRSAAQVGVQNHASGVDYRAQRITQCLAELICDRPRETGERKLHRIFIQKA